MFTLTIINLKKSKLLEIYKAFDLEELDRLELFLESPYFVQANSSQQKVLHLFHSIKPYYPIFSDIEFTRKSIYKVVFPNEKFQPGRLDKVMSALFKKIEQFVVIDNQVQQSKSFLAQLNLSEFYLRKGLKRLYEISIKNLEKHQAKIIAKDKTDLHNDHLLQHFVSVNHSISNKRDDDLNLPNAIKTLDIYYLANRLEHVCGLLAQTNFHSPSDIAYYLEIITILKPIIENSVHSKIPLIKVYSNLFQMLSQQKNDAVENLIRIKALENLLQKYSDHLSKLHLVSIHSLNRSFLSLNLNLGHKDLNSYAFQMYRDHLNKNLLSLHGGIHPANFKNIVSIALQEREYDWVKNFLKKYKNEIVGTEHPEEVHQFNLANYYFHIGKIEKAQDALGENYEDLYYKLAAKRLEIKIYYELKSELLEYKLNAFKQFVHRISKSKLPEAARKSNNNFINGLKQIISPSNITQANRKKLYAKLQKTAAVKDKEWLLSLLK